MKRPRHVCLATVLWALLGCPPIADFQLTVDEAEAAISTAVSNVTSPGWSNNRFRVVFYNGSRYFLLYTKGDGTIYYKSSTDNVTWTGESTVITGASNVFNIYLVDDGKFDLAYFGSPNSTYAKTCTIFWRNDHLRQRLEP